MSNVNAVRRGDFAVIRAFIRVRLVISVDPASAGAAPAITVVTLEGVSGMTLQQLSAVRRALPRVGPGMPTCR